MRPPFIPNELYNQLHENGWEYETDEDGFGSLHFIVVTAGGQSGVSLDCLIFNQEQGLLLYSEFEMDGGVRMEKSPQQNGRNVLIKDLMKYSFPYLSRGFDENIEVLC